MMGWLDFSRPRQVTPPAETDSAAPPAPAAEVPVAQATAIWEAPPSRQAAKLPRPEVTSVACRLPVSIYSTGFQSALARSIRPKTRTARLRPPEIRTSSLAVPTVRPRTFSFHFAAPKKVELTQPPGESPATPALLPESTAEQPAKQTVTRIAPPRDIIRLEDRLYYLLQPPVETWAGSQALKFPFEPFPYQYEGVAFLYPRHAAILADEMGLGKTMQSITTIRLLLHAGEASRVLLVCPKPLVSNWKREFSVWAPEVPLLVIEGDQARRRWQWQLEDVPVKLANYELLQRDQDVILEQGRHWDLVVLDESQRIKNRANNTAKIVHSISRDRSWALTGTPVENSADDLVGIFEFVSPGTINSDMKLRRMGQIASDFIIRRTKDKVLQDMPPKLFRDARIELTAEQRETYRLAEEEGILRLSHLGAEASIQHVFELVLRLKQICNFDPATGQSAKLERLSADLEEVAASGQKAIVFSQWTKTLGHLRQHLSQFGPLEYHGQIPSHKRDAIIERFRNESDCKVLLMSYGAGGVGLNLQFTNYVFLFDRWWNPAIEDQAINRAHRIGVNGAVTVSRFVSLGTIEERIDQILEDKREIADTIFSDLRPGSSGLNRDEIFGLFNLRTPRNQEDQRQAA